MKRFLIINPFGIGDVLFTLPTIKSIKRHYPDAFIGYWCNERVEDILKDNPNIDKIFAISRGDLKKIFRISKWRGIKYLLRLVRGIRRERFDICFDFSLDYRYSLISKILGIRRRIGLNYKNRGKFLTDKIDVIGYQDKHAIEYYADLLKFINIETQDKNLDLFLSKENILRGRDILDKLGISPGDVVIGLVPGGGLSWGEHGLFRHWSAERFAQLADRLTEDLKAIIVIFGDASEIAIADKITALMKNKTLNLAGKTTLAELAGVLSNLPLLICNDSGTLHIAKALKLKTVSLFGPGDENAYGPYPLTDRDIIIKKEMSCRPCYKNFHFYGCSNNHKCLEDITVDEVYTAARKII